MADERLIEIVAEPASTLAEVLTKMEHLDSVLDMQDGLKWFNLLYLMVTKEVVEHPPEGGWNDPAWIAQLDVCFANLYFDALRAGINDPGNATKAWRVLFGARAHERIMRVQFALCGMNAHINRDLQVALFETYGLSGLRAQQDSPQHRDFEHINTILDVVEPRAMEFLATGIVGCIDEGLGQLDNILARWSIRRARETSWFDSQILWTLRDSNFLRGQHLKIVDQYTSFAGRLLIVPVQ
jgi:hypothetical protein